MAIPLHLVENPPITARDLQDAARGIGLSAHLQPVVDLTRAAVVGFECLARFEGPEGPLAWIRAARVVGLGAELEAAALRAGLAHRSSLPVNTFLTVNVSPDMLRLGPVQAVFEAHGCLDRVVVELTEEARIESYDDLEAPLRELREAGATIAVDDAGAGYAGLSHLLHLRPDFVKLDREIVAGLDRDEAKRAMVEMMGILAGRLDAWVIAEGLETAAELAVLLDLGVPLAQGYHLGRPAPGFTELDPEVVSYIRSRATTAGGSSVRALVETAITVSDRRLAEQLVVPDGDPVVVLDLAGRPLGTVRPDRRWWPTHGGALRIHVDTSVADAAARAITRLQPVRFDPIVCTDDAGLFVGVVRLERLVDTLARS